MHQWRMAEFVAVLLGILASTGSVVAESSTEFFTGKQITMIVPSGVGGGYDLYGRFLARFIGKHIPGNPTVSRTCQRPAASERPIICIPLPRQMGSRWACSKIPLR